MIVMIGDVLWIALECRLCWISEEADDEDR